jgi:hypothetical protein
MIYGQDRTKKEMCNLTETEISVMNKMIELYKGDPKRIQHFIKVNAFAVYIAKSEKVDLETEFIISLASLVHDIGIHESEKKYNSTSGRYQEIEGPPIAEKLLLSCGIEKNIVDRVCFLVGHHHTYKNITEIDYQILVEADFIVNLYEDNITNESSITSTKNNIFRTRTGIKLLELNFLEKRD